MPFTVHANATGTQEIIRHEGHSRENVAGSVAKAHFSSSNKVILVNRDKFPDAISATNISQGKYPVLYTRAGNVSDSTIQLMKTMPLDEIYILGGSLSVNDSVVTQLKKEINVKVTRIAGRSRYDANASAVEKNFTQASHVVIASGEVYSDALYGVSYANTLDSPVILTKTNKLEKSSIEQLKKLNAKEVTIIGGTLTVTVSVEKQLSELGIKHNRIAGRNRYIGSTEVANAAYSEPENIVIASGEVFSDALVSAPLAQKLNAPILLVKAHSLEDITLNYLSSKKATKKNIYIQGGTSTVSKELVEKIKTANEEVLTENRTVVEDLPYNTIKQLNKNLYDDEERIIQKGIVGKREKIYKLTYKNGIKVSEEVISEKTTIKPIDEIIEYGLKKREDKENVLDKDLFNQEMLYLVNDFRKSEGVNPLTYNHEFQSQTDLRSMEIQGKFSHDRPDGSFFVTAFGFEGNNYYLGENIATNYITADDIKKSKEGTKSLERLIAEKIFTQYYMSKGHRENMVSDSFVAFVSSISVLNGEDVYNVQIFDTGVR